VADRFLISLLKAVDSFISSLAGMSPEAEIPLSDSPRARYVHAGEAVRPTGIAAIRDADPEFDLAEFLVRVGQMFSAYHEAIDRGDLKPVRRFVEEASYADLESAATKAGRNPGGSRALTVKSIRPITAEHEYGLDLVRVFITADQAGTDEVLCEYWELVRKRGTLTKHGLDLTHCPNCGGPVDGLDPTRCAYCDTRLADPALDWVARKITAQ
jgi:hypothetical protein